MRGLQTNTAPSKPHDHSPCAVDDLLYIIVNNFPHEIKSKHPQVPKDMLRDWVDQVVMKNKWCLDDLQNIDYAVVPGACVHVVLTFCHHKTGKKAVYEFDVV